MITVEQVQDLNPGDVVELTSNEHPGVKIVGPLRDSHGDLLLGCWAVIRYSDGDTPKLPTRELRVVKRGGPPLYTNSTRTEPTQGDVVRLPGERPHYADNLTWWFTGKEWWSLHRSRPGPIVGDMPRPAVLLVDGVTGRAVQ